MSLWRWGGEGGWVHSCNIDWWIMVGLGSSNKKVCDNKIPPDPLLSRFESQRNIVVTVHVQSGTVVHTLDFIIVYLHPSHYIYIWGGSCKGGYPSRQDINQGAKKVIFKACHSGKLKREYTSPNVISTSPKNILMSRIAFTVLLQFEFLKKLHLPIRQVKNKISFASPIAKSTSPGLSDSTFFAFCQCYNKKERK